MSWHARAENVTDEPKGNAAKVVQAIELQYAPQEEVKAEVAAQLAAAKVSAIALIVSGAVGAGPWDVSLSGHARPGHAVASGWSTPDTIGVNVSTRWQPEPPHGHGHEPHGHGHR